MVAYLSIDSVIVSKQVHGASWLQQQEAALRLFSVHYVTKDLC